MTRVTVPASEVIETLREVVAEQPDYTYEAPAHMAGEGAPLSCFYVHVGGNDEPDTPGCLVGHVLNRLGVPLDRLAMYEGTGSGGMLASVLEITGPLDEIYRVDEALALAQDAQDNGSTWADALEAATRKPGE
ncbi:hypothetical protein PV343_01365 [Streptomyces sp. WI03-4A]|uniref:hypothetical protein n=1 Tax=Streptomyces sp. WI03-4A TaxID=3028706 RepID=UPI0029BE327E|nr:hypothetical protein [Streptomyces sp. WI03-4A]MDX2590973.1 hypothetical protein [Streptomyces sp. WI03-4A]